MPAAELLPRNHLHAMDTLHAFEGKAPFSPPVLAKVDQLKAVYGLTLTAADAHTLKEQQ